MAQRTFEIQSRNIFCGPEKRSFGELFESSFQIDFADDAATTKTFTIKIESDKLRFVESGEYFTNQTYQGPLSSTNRVKVRHNFQMVPRVDFIGSFFKYTITKSIPTTGIFSVYGCSMSVIPLNTDQEFMISLDTITVGY